MDNQRHVITAICVGKAEPINDQGKISGIFKMPVQGSIRINKLGLDGDTVCDTKRHGGPLKAVYVMGSVDLDWWSGELGRPLPAGIFGENLIIEGLDSQSIRIGDLLVAGLELEVTRPRIPCATLAQRMDDRLFPRKFMAARRPGFYCRVNQPGCLTTGESVVHQKASDDTPLLLDRFKPSS